MMMGKMCIRDSTYTAPGNYTATFSVVDAMGARDEASLEIEVKWLPRATVEPETIEVTLPPIGSTTEIVTIGNVEGNADLTFEVKVKGCLLYTSVIRRRIPRCP